MKPVFLSTYIERMRGMFCKKYQDTRYLLVFVRCNSVHTFFLPCRIDVAFIDNMGRVIKAYRNVEGFRLLRESHACIVLERCASESPWFTQGEQIRLSGATR